MQWWATILFFWIGDPDHDPLFILLCGSFPDPYIYIYIYICVMYTCYVYSDMIY